MRCRVNATLGTDFYSVKRNQSVLRFSGADTHEQVAVLRAFLTITAHSYSSWKKGSNFWRLASEQIKQTTTSTARPHASSHV